MNSSRKSVMAAFAAAALLFGAACSRDDGRTAGQTVDDTAIGTKVRAAFAQDSGVRVRDVKVDTYQGTVQLSGWVNTPEEKARAEQIAKGIPGVKNVENKIELKAGATTDAKTEAKTTP